MTNAINTSYANRDRREQADRYWQQLLTQAMRRGFYGTAAIEVNVIDGTVQHIKRRLEQIDK